MHLLWISCVFPLYWHCCVTVFTGSTCPQPLQFIQVTSNVYIPTCNLTTLTFTIPVGYSSARVKSLKKNRCAMTCSHADACFLYRAHTDGSCQQCLATDSLVLETGTHILSGPGITFRKSLGSQPWFYGDLCVWDPYGFNNGETYITSPTLTNAARVTGIEFCLSSSHGSIPSLIFKLHYDGVLVDGASTFRDDELTICTDHTSFNVAEGDYITGVDIQKKTILTAAYIMNMNLHTHLGDTSGPIYSVNGGSWTYTNGNNLRAFFGVTQMRLRSVGVIYDSCTPAP